MRQSIEKLCLNDSSVKIEEDSSPALGQGYRIGFLGLLHMEVFKERLENGIIFVIPYILIYKIYKKYLCILKEFNQSVIITSPNVPYKLSLSNPRLIKQHGKNELTIINPKLWPDPVSFNESYEPVVIGTIICPSESLNPVNQLCLVN